MKTSLKLGLIVTTIMASQSALAEYDYFNNAYSDGGFKRYSISAGWLRAMPQGDPNHMRTGTAVDSNTKYNSGATRVDDLIPAIVDPAKKQILTNLRGVTGLDPIPAAIAGTSQITSLGSWDSPNTGLTSDTANTLGLLFNYYANDNVSLEVKAGIPPKVKIKGTGTVYAPLQGKVYPAGLGAAVLGTSADINIPIQISDLAQGNGVASTAKAWLPAVEAHYRFGKSGVNKFRPYVGAGVMYAHFTNLESGKGVESDLKVAGYRIQSIIDGKAGAGLASKQAILASSSYNANDYTVQIKASDAFVPIATIGATYDFNSRLYAVGSVSYSKLHNDSKILVKNAKTDGTLITATSKIDIDPIITYLGVGYRF